MKRHTLILLVFLTALLTSCTTVDSRADSKLLANSWELEYITGARIVFQGLFPEQKSVINFKQDLGRIIGTTGCNGYNAKYTVQQNKISINTPEISTLRYCGDGEVFFLKSMGDIDHFRILPDGKLELLKNEIPMLRFHPVKN